MSLAPPHKGSHQPEGIQRAFIRVVERAKKGLWVEKGLQTPCLVAIQKGDPQADCLQASRSLLHERQLLRVLDQQQATCPQEADRVIQLGLKRGEPREAPQRQVEA